MFQILAWVMFITLASSQSIQTIGTFESEDACATVRDTLKRTFAKSAAVCVRVPDAAPAPQAGAPPPPAPPKQ
jgi:hypothetical protein